MAEEKVVVSKKYLDAAAESIRSKTEKTEKLLLSQFAEEIDGIKSGGEELLKSVIDGTVTDLVIPQGVTEIKCKLDNFTSLRTLIIPDGVTSVVGGAFDHCKGLWYAYAPQSLQSFGSHNTGNLGTYDKPVLCTERAQSAFSSSASNGWAIRYECGWLDKEGGFVVGNVNPSALYGNLARAIVAWFGTESEAKMPKLTEDVILYEKAFNFCGCESITVADRVKYVQSGAFYKCASLRSVTFEGTPTKISTTAFEDCTALKDIYVPWAQEAVQFAPWGADSATIHYNGEGV